MKYINKFFVLLAAGAVFSLSSCIEETVPEDNIATAEQVNSNPLGIQGSLNGLATAMSQGYYVYSGEQVHETDMAYPAYMIAQTEMLSDMFPLGSNSGYDWYRTYNVGSQTGSIGYNSYYAYLPWFTFYKFIKICNDAISSVDINTETDAVKISSLGSAYAARAFNYYMLTVLYEPVANEYMDGAQMAKVLGNNAPHTALTVTKVTEETTGEMAKKNPRMTHDEVVEFMLSDLDNAEKCLSQHNLAVGATPNLAVVYGIKAKVYLWHQDYKNAAKYARMAIMESGAPMTQDEWLDKSGAFSKACAGWMWYLQYSAENMGNLCNYVGWASAEADWGYSSLTCPGINKILYDKIAASDFRKGAFLDPDRNVTLSYHKNKWENLTCRDKKFIEDAPDYLAIKIRPANGNWEDYTVGGASQVPVMRVEEMYFIEALAQGEQSVADGLALLNSFMKTYRDKKYSYNTADVKEFEQEVLAQMRIEFWGEGNAFPIAKRVGMDVLCNYDGTNAPADIFKVNMKGGKPTWTLCIPTYETQSNQVLEDQNNPDPSAILKYPTPIGEFATKK